jgi:hypothetical protein
MFRKVPSLKKGLHCVVMLSQGRHPTARRAFMDHGFLMLVMTEFTAAETQNRPQFGRPVVGRSGEGATLSAA